MYTDRVKYYEGALKYKKAVELYPDSAILNIFYKTALLNDAKIKITDPKQLESVTRSYVQEISSYMKSGQLPLNTEI